MAQNWNMITRVRPAHPGDELLDFGSAWGAFGAAAMRDQVIPNGIELQPEGAAHSRMIWPKQSTVHEGAIETAPFKDGRFQFVTSFETLEHVADPIRIMKHMARLTALDGVVAVSMPSADYFAFKYWLYRVQPLSGWLRRRFPGNMQQDRVLIHNHLITPTVKSATLMMELAGLEVIHAGIYCSGLSGGRLGKALKVVGQVLWPLSGRRIAFAPSVFVVGRPKATGSSRAI
jgi:2-polyprenyl-3-methyl-5-hydroxy-6-metoxy-1,4-benzoquinol methylase